MYEVLWPLQKSLWSLLSTWFSLERLPQDSLLSVHAFWPRIVDGPSWVTVEHYTFPHFLQEGIQCVWADGQHGLAQPGPEAPNALPNPASMYLNPETCWCSFLGLVFAVTGPWHGRWWWRALLLTGCVAWFSYVTHLSVSACFECGDSSSAFLTGFMWGPGENMYVRCLTQCQAWNASSIS